MFNFLIFMTESELEETDINLNQEFHRTSRLGLSVGQSYRYMLLTWIPVTSKFTALLLLWALGELCCLGRIILKEKMSSFIKVAKYPSLVHLSQLKLSDPSDRFVNDKCNKRIFKKNSLCLSGKSKP
jgi:hypothetical protein